MWLQLRGRQLLEGRTARERGSVLGETADEDLVRPRKQLCNPLT